ncbi:glycosyltransferase family 39 protein, partial [uncultured Megasphaera sp.]|uniref:ArnT family glycosyltransferase n=1 Tax=uncultured Megasphaera sp. TaxID=165188 RepID=UPI002588AA28
MQSIQYLKRHPYVLLTLCALVLFLAANNFLAITDSAESNYALTAKEMVLSGNWVSPQIYGHYWYDKPIFYYWELAASFAVFGFNEFAARFPAAIMGTLSVLFTYWFAARVYGRRLGMAAAIIYMTSIEGWLLSKAVITDATPLLFP